MKEFGPSGYPEEFQSLMPVYRGLGIGRNLRGLELESFTEAIAINALNLFGKK